MARLHEYQGKALLRQLGIPVPKGAAAETADEARAIALDLAVPVVIKAQVWVTGRAGQNLVHFADNPDEVAQIAQTLLGRRVGNFQVEKILIEERVAIAQEFYLGMIIDDYSRAPLLIFSSVGGTG